VCAFLHSTCPSGGDHRTLRYDEWTPERRADSATSNWSDQAGRSLRACTLHRIRHANVLTPIGATSSNCLVFGRTYAK
jgi:hypothetical protein